MYKILTGNIFFLFKFLALKVGISSCTGAVKDDGA